MGCCLLCTHVIVFLVAVLMSFYFETESYTEEEKIPLGKDTYVLVQNTSIQIIQANNRIIPLNDSQVREILAKRGNEIIKLSNEKEHIYLNQ